MVRTTDLKETPSKRDTTNSSYEILNITKIKDTLPSYKNKNLPEKQNEAVVRKRKLTMKESKDAMKALGLY